MQLNQHACCGRRVEGVKDCAHHQQGCRCCTEVLWSACILRVQASALGTAGAARQTHRVPGQAGGHRTSAARVQEVDRPRHHRSQLQVGPGDQDLSCLGNTKADADGCPGMQLCILVLDEYLYLPCSDSLTPRLAACSTKLVLRSTCFAGRERRLSCVRKRSRSRPGRLPGQCSRPSWPIKLPSGRSTGTTRRWKWPRRRQPWRRPSGSGCPRTKAARI